MVFLRREIDAGFTCLYSHLLAGSDGGISLMDMPKPTLSIGDLRPHEVVFTWEDDDTGIQYTFAVDRILKAAKASPDVQIVRAVIDHELADTFPDIRDLEGHRLLWLSTHPDNWEPVLDCQMPDGSYLMIDGSHRYYLGHLCGWPTILSALIPQKVWEPFLIDMPKGPLKGYSGL